MISIDYETADRIAICVMKDQLKYLLEEQKWFEASPEERASLSKETRTLWVHPEDYALNRDKYIPALQTLIAYFGGTCESTLEN